MNRIFTVLAALAFPLVAVAQQFDNPVAIPVSYYGEAVTNTNAGSYFNFGSSIGSPATASATAPGGTTFYSTLQTTSLLPGKDYNVTVTSSGCAVVFAHFAPVNGCDVFIRGTKMNSYTEGGGTFTFTVRLEKINDITSSLAGKRGGQCVSFPEDKPIWYIGLGSLRSGKFAGAVGFRAPTITSSIFNTSSLIYDTVDSSEVSVSRDTTGYITRIDSRDVVLMMDAYNASGTSYSIRAYSPTNLTTPFITYTVSQYATGGVNGIRVDKVEDSATWSTVLYQSGANWTMYDWQRVSGSGAALATGNPVTTTVSGSTSTVNYGSGSGMLVKQKTYSSGELASVTWGPGTTSAPVTSYAYYTSSSGTGWTSAVQSVVEPSGRWTKYDYFNGATDTRGGQIQRIYRPWLDAPSAPGSATTANCLVETYDYVANYDGAFTAPASKEVRINNTVMGMTTWAYNWNYATVNSQTIAQTVEQASSSSGHYLTTTTLSYRPDNPTTFYRDKLHAVTRPDGTKDAYAYFNGTWNASTRVFSVYSGGGARQTLVFHGQAAGSGTAVSSWNGWVLDTIYLVSNVSTVTEMVVDNQGRVVVNAEHVFTGTNTEQIAAQVSTYNGNNLLSVQKDMVRSVAAVGGDVAVSYGYAAGQLTSRTDIDGTQTAWTYDSYLRNDTITTASGGTGNYPAKTQTFSYYSSNLKNTSQECSCSPTVTTYSYESTGRPASVTEPKPGGGTLSTIYSYPSLVQVAVTLPTGATRTTTLYLDGKEKSQTGNGQVNTSTNYSYDGTYFYKTTQNGATNANGWVEEKSDWRGRIVTQRSPQVGWTSGSTKVTCKTYSYNSSTGKLSSISTTDEGTSGTPRILPDHFYVYGDLGLLAREGDDVTANGALDDSSADRITLYTTNFSKETADNFGWIRQDLTEVYNALGGTGRTKITDHRTRLTGFNGGALLNGNSRVLSDVEEYDSNGRRSRTQVWSDFSARTRTQSQLLDGVTQSATTIWQDGYLKSEQSVSGVTKTYAYNSVGLISNVTEGTTNAAISYMYHGGTKYVSSVVQTTGLSSTATTNYAYTWDASANSSTVVATDAATSTVAYTESNALGLPWRTWGTAAQPTLTTYDAYGRRTNLTTWQSGTFTGTTWPSSPPSGNMVTWNLDPATGAVTSKLYPNTSSVGFTYNARGQVKTRSWARGVTTTYNYFDSSGSQTGELQGISYSDGTQGVGYTYTRFGSPLTVTDAAGTRTLNYRIDLQVNTETLGSFYGSRTLTPSYDPHGQPTGYSFNGSSTVSATLGLDGGTGRPNSIVGTLGSTSVGFTLGYAAGTNWVSSVTDGSGSYTRSTPLFSKYDVIASATTSWAGTPLGSFTAQYNSRGWRTGQASGSSGGTSAGSWSKLLNLGDGLVAGTATYDGYGQLLSTPTPSWQAAAGSVSLAARNLTWSYDLAGNRLTETDTAITSYTADSINRYSSITGQRAEPGINYDADGNLTQDATWTYTYDAENRLKSATKTGQTLTFMYDYLGRRIAKTVNGATTTFLWSSWKLAAELASDGITPQKSFVWGADFSDAQGNAGGAGSLLAQISGSVVSYAIPDAYGTIVGYISGGIIAAAVEFSPYGKGINAYGSWVSYPIGYASQYMDWEMGVVYYGLRYYAPKHGRFINRDPIEEVGGNNLYSFVGNRPIRAWDVLGLDDGCTFDCDSSGCHLKCPRSSWPSGVTQYEFTLNQWGAYLSYQSVGVTGGTFDVSQVVSAFQATTPSKTNCGGSSATGMVGDALTGAGMPTVPKPGAPFGSLPATSPASVAARDMFGNIELPVRVPTPTVNTLTGAPVASSNLGAIVGRYAPVVGTGLMIWDISTSSNPARTATANLFGTIGATIGGAIGTPLGLPLTGAVIGATAGNLSGGVIYDAEMKRADDQRKNPLRRCPGGGL